MSSEAKSIRIRPMTTTDVDRVVEIAGSLKDAPQWQRHAYQAALISGDILRRVGLVAEELGTGALVGFAVASLTPPDAELETIGVAAGFQRHGVGRHIFDEVARVLRNAGVKSITLEVRGSNVAAGGLYKSLGFVEVGRRRRYYADPIEDAVLMRLHLK